nr:DUF806 family protein [Pullulanibacillus pueri]
MGFNPDYVFNYFIPDKMPDGTPKEQVSVLVLLTDIQNIPGDYSSNVSHSVEGKVQIQIWYEFTDTSDYETLLRKYMEANGFYMYNSYTDKDPDIEKLYLTAKFNKNTFD